MRYPTVILSVSEESITLLTAVVIHRKFTPFVLACNFADSTLPIPDYVRWLFRRFSGRQTNLNVGAGNQPAAWCVSCCNRVTYRGSTIGRIA